MAQAKSTTRKILLRYISGNVLILFLPILLAGIYYEISLRGIEKSIDTTTISQISGNMSDIERFLLDIRQMSIQLSNDYDINFYLSSDKPLNNIEYYRLKTISQKLAPYVFGNTIMNHAFLYMEKSGFIVFENGFGLFDDIFGNIFIVEDYSAERWKNEILRSAGGEAFFHDQVISMGGENFTGHIYRRPIGYGDYYLGAIVAVLNRSALNKMLTEIPQKYGGWGFIQDENGSILASTNPDKAEIERTLGILPDADTYGYQSAGYRIYRLTSAFNGWKYNAVLSEARIYEGVRIIRTIAYILLLSAFSIGIAVSFFVAYTNTRPLGRLFDLILREQGKPAVRASSIYEQVESAIVLLSSRKRYLENEVRAAEKITRTYFFQNLLRGYYRARGEFAKDREMFNIVFSEKPYYVIICRLDALNAVREDASFARIRDALLKAAGRYCGEYDFIVPVSFDDIAVLRSTDPARSLRADAAAFLDHIRADIDTGMRGDFTFGIGTVTHDPYLLIISYSQAATAVSTLDHSRHEFVHFYDDILRIGDSFFYPIDLEESILRAVRSANADLLDSLIRRIKHDNLAARSLTVEQMRDLLYGLKVTIFRLFDDMQAVHPAIRERVAVWSDLPPSPERLDEYGEILNVLMAAHNQDKQGLNTAFKEAIRNYINDHFADPELGLMTIAREFGKSENYISNFYKEQAGECLSNAIQHIRFNKALQLLQETNDSVENIAVRCGYTRTNSFRRAFKRIYGMSPSEYRIRMLKNRVLTNIR